MMRFNYVLFLATVCSCILAEYDRNCTSFITMVNLYEAYCPNVHDTKLFIQINGDKIEVTCSDESAWADFEYYLPITHLWNVEDVSLVKCSWPYTSLRDIFRAARKFEMKSFTFSDGYNFSPAPSKFDLKEMANVQELTLSRNGLRRLPADLFEEFAYLHKLNLSGNNIGFLNPEIFNHVTNLTILDLSDNNMMWIYELLFQNLTRLKHLSLMKNHLTSLHADTFRGPTNLRSLNIADNRLATLPKDLFAFLPNLTSIRISGNPLSAINEQMFAGNVELNSLYFGNIRGNSPKSLALPRFLYILPKLEELELTRNDLRNLSENIFQKNVNLKRLNLSENALKTLPKDIFKGLKDLEILDISVNRLNNVHPDTFSPLTSLKELNLEWNNLTTVYPIPASVQILNAAHNRIINISEDFDYLGFGNRKLRVLRLSDNLVGTSIQNIIFLLAWLPAVCEDLEELYLDYNGLGNLQYLLLKDFTHLRVVDLSNNRLDEFQLSYPFKTSQPATIDVRHNMINTITVVPSAYSCPKRETYIVDNVLVRFGGNPINCDCECYGLLKSLDSTRNPNSQFCYRIDADNLTCSSPSWMKGVPVLELDPKNFICRRNTSLVDCPENCECWWRPDDGTRLVNCTHRNLTQAPELIGGFDMSPIELNLTGNHLTEMPLLSDLGYEFVTKLFLSYNNISTGTLDVVSSNVKVLELDHNNLKIFDSYTKRVIRKARNLKRITMHGNPWDCSRESRNFLEFIDQKYLTRTTLSSGKHCLDQIDVQNGIHPPKLHISFIRF